MKEVLLVVILNAMIALVLTIGCAQLLRITSRLYFSIVLLFLLVVTFIGSLIGLAINDAYQINNLILVRVVFPGGVALVFAALLVITRRLRD